MTIECMIDLETFGLPPKGMPISIGAVKFTMGTPDKDGVQTPEIIDRFHLAIDPDTFGTLDFEITPSTVRWWMSAKQDEGRKAWDAAPKFDIGTALDSFHEWYGNVSMAGHEMPEAVWGNGVSFDIVLMNHAYKAVNREAPWKFYQERCHRTIKNLVPDNVAQAGFKRGLELASPGVLHSALFDAEVQAWQNIACRTYLYGAG